MGLHGTLYWQTAKVPCSRDTLHSCAHCVERRSSSDCEEQRSPGSGRQRSLPQTNDPFDEADLQSLRVCTTLNGSRVVVCDSEDGQVRPLNTKKCQTSNPQNSAPVSTACGRGGPGAEQHLVSCVLPSASIIWQCAAAESASPVHVWRARPRQN